MKEKNKIIYQSKEEMIIMPEDIEEIRRKRRKEREKKKTKGRTRNVILLFLSLTFFIFTSYFLITPAGSFDFSFFIFRLLGQLFIPVVILGLISYFIWGLAFKEKREFLSIFSLVVFFAASFGFIVTLFKILS